MPATAKVFSTANNQSVRLPKALRVDVAEMWIGENEVTGEISLQPKDDADHEQRIDALLKLIEDHPMPDDFLSETSRRNGPLCNPFADRAAPTDGNQAVRGGEHEGSIT